MRHLQKKALIISAFRSEPLKLLTLKALTLQALTLKAVTVKALKLKLQFHLLFQAR